MALNELVIMEAREGILYAECQQAVNPDTNPNGVQIAGPDSKHLLIVSVLFDYNFNTSTSRHSRPITVMYSAFACSGSCPVPGHVILTCKLHISGKI